MTQPFTPPRPHLSLTARDELCSRCGRRAGEHIVRRMSLWCVKDCDIGEHQFQPSGMYQGQGCQQMTLPESG